MNSSRIAQGNDKAIIVQNFPTDDLEDLFLNVFRTTAAAEDLRHIRRADWRSHRAYEAAMSSDYLRPDDEVLAEMRDDCDLHLALRRGGNLVQLFACRKFGGVHIVVAGRDARSAEACLGEHRERFDPPSNHARSDRPSVEFAFWYMAEEGPQREEKVLTVPGWREIRQNYAAHTAMAIDGLVSDFKPGAGGRLLLWQGKPGTGKTFAIRALAWEWREWCRFEYVFDPENLFGRHADYLARMILNGGESEGEDAGARWRVLVLEDTGELLSIDAKERAGQGLSRLLNAVDGLLGQGSRVLLLITTNEDLGALHPAVTRPGRCAAQVGFLPLSGVEAKAWLSQRRSGAFASGPGTIAELYALFEGRAFSERRRIGFGRQ